MTDIIVKDALIFTLPDGRKLSYSVYGQKSGSPLFFFHGIPGTRLQRSPDLSIFEELPILVYALDRPGYGSSTYQKHRQLLDWPDDVQNFADKNGIDQFGVMGISGGAPYALACAYKLADRLNHITVISGLAPLTVKENFSQLSDGGKLLFKAASNTPFLVEQLMSLFFKRLHIPLDAAFEKFMTDLPSGDTRLLSDPKIAEMFKRDVAEAFKQGTQGVVHDISILNSDWNFSLSDINSQVHVWHGAADTIVPRPFGEYLIQQLPAAIPHIIDDEGHFMAIERMKEIFGVLLENK